MNSKFLKAVLAATALSAVPFAAGAADIPVKSRQPYYKAQPDMVSYYNWSGFYAGINGGYGFGSADWTTPASSSSPKGAMVGGTVGYNWQSGAMVYGVEGDYDYSWVEGNAACGAGTCTTANRWLATFRGRLGYSFDRYMPYITGGGAYGNVRASSTLLGSASSTELGWTAGAGLEYAFMSNWTAKAEYLYVDLGNVRGPGVSTVSFQENVIRAGLNYKFSGPLISRF